MIELSYVQVIVSVGQLKQTPNYPRRKCAYSVTNQVLAASLYSQFSSEDKLKT